VAEPLFVATLRVTLAGEYPVPAVEAFVVLANAVNEPLSSTQAFPTWEIFTSSRLANCVAMVIPFCAVPAPAMAVVCHVG